MIFCSIFLIFLFDFHCLLVAVQFFLFVYRTGCSNSSFSVSTFCHFHFERNSWMKAQKFHRIKVNTLRNDQKVADVFDREKKNQVFYPILSIRWNSDRISLNSIKTFKSLLCAFDKSISRRWFPLNFLTLFVALTLVSVLYQKRFKKERKARIRVQQKLESEMKRRNQIEDTLKASGAPAEALRMLSGKLNELPTFLC